MYCKHCGAQYQSPEAVMCVKCGAPKGEGNNFCYNCGHPLNPGAVVCTNCGCSNATVPSVSAKSRIAAGLLGIFLGTFGVHNFYLGYTSKAVLQLVLSIVGLVFSCIGIGAILVWGIGIWGLVEGIMLLAGGIKVDGEGKPLKD